MAKASIELKGMLVVYLVSLSRAWTNVALGRSASGDTVLIKSSASGQCAHIALFLPWFILPGLTKLSSPPLNTTDAWGNEPFGNNNELNDQRMSTRRVCSTRAHRGIICTWNVLCNDHRGQRQRNAKNPNLLTVLLWILALTCWFPTLSLEKEEKPSPSKCLKSTAVFTS